MDRRLLESNYYLTVQDITFASDEIGDPANGRTAETAWAQTDTVVFKGKLKHILTFALMAFDVAGVAILEKFELTPARKFLNVPNLTGADLVAVIDLDPVAGEGIVTDEDMTFLANLTNQFRLNWTDEKNIALEIKSSGVVSLYRGSVLEALAYALQVHDSLNAVVYTLYDIALLDVGSGVSKGVTFIDIAGASGPVELSKAHVTLGNLILSVSSC